MATRSQVSEYWLYLVPPDILVEASSGEVVVQEGQTATLTCSAIGTPAPTLTWRREDGLHFRTHNDTLGMDHLASHIFP